MNARMESTGSPSSQYGSQDAEGHMAGRGAAALQHGKDRLVQDLQAVVNDAQGLLKEAMAASAEGVGAVPGYVQERLAVVKGKLHEAKSTMEHKVKQVAESGEHYVRENPWRAVGIVCVTSVVLSLVMVSAFSSVLRRN